MWRKAPKEVLDKDILDKMCKTHIDGSLIADSLVKILEQQENQNDERKITKSN